MGFLDGFRRIKDPVRGSAQVVSTTRAPHAATSGTCRMNLVVSVPGSPSFPVDDSFIVSVARWPHPGMVLPIEASQKDPTRFKILWDEMASHHDSAAAQAHQLAAQINQGPVPPAGFPVTAVGQPVVMVDGRPATPEEIQAYEAQTGLDLDGDGRIAGGQPAPPGGIASIIAAATGAVGPAPSTPPPPAGTDDRIEALERLVALRDAGALTDAEFEAEKARLLGG